MTNKQRVTELITLLNKATGSPTEPYLTDKAGDFIRRNGCVISNAGCFMLDGCSTGYRVERMAEGGGITTPFGHERYSLGKLAVMLHRVLDGVQLGKLTERRTAERLAAGMPECPICHETKNVYLSESPSFPASMFFLRKSAGKRYKHACVECECVFTDKNV